MIALGTDTRRIRPPFQATTTVAMPFISKALATSPTDWWQIGQTGASSAASTRSDLAMASTSGTNSSTTRAEST